VVKVDKKYAMIIIEINAPREEREEQTAVEAETKRVGEKERDR
jgi:hypothetical protein